uniref:Uncharacterized protein n=1 Tax=viral metagenome TaxID=1070528 RepID=A0A6M3MB29_9ZZZZ
MEPWFGPLVPWRNDELGTIPWDIRSRIVGTFNFTRKHVIYCPDGVYLLGD